MPVSITALYAGILGLLFTLLAINVTVHRAKFKVAFADGGDPQMMRIMRLHGNTAEYVPIVLILMGLYELDHGLPLALHIAGIAVIVGRLIYVAGTWKTDLGPGRIVGTLVTWATVAALAALNLWQLA